MCQNLDHLLVALRFPGQRVPVSTSSCLPAASRSQFPPGAGYWEGNLIPPLLVPLMSVFCFARFCSVLVSRFALLAKFCLIFNSEPDSYLFWILLLPCILVAASLVPDPSPVPPPSVHVWYYHVYLCSSF